MSIGNTELSDLKSELSQLKIRIEDLERRSEILWDLVMRLNKSHLVRGASHALVWRAKLNVPQHIPPHHIKLLDQLYTELQKKKNWTVAKPYRESIWIYECLYLDGITRDEARLSNTRKRILAKAEKWRNPSKAPAGLSTIHTEALAQGRVDQLFLVKLNNIVSIFAQNLQLSLYGSETRYENTVEERNEAAHETTAALQARFMESLKGDDQVFFGTLFHIIFGFAYNEIQTQDIATQEQTLENCKFLLIQHFNFISNSATSSGQRQYTLFESRDHPIHSSEGLD